jgi:predicted NACHT family NTPase
MQRKIAMLILVCLFASIFLWWGVLPSKIHAFIIFSSSSLSLASPIAAASPTSSINASSSGGSLDPAIVAAIIGLVAVVIVAVIGGVFGLYQVRRRQRVEKERQADQFRHEEEIARFQKELERQYKAKEQEEQNKATTAEALRLKMLLAPASERLKTYQAALHADPRISQLQILDMLRPLDIANVFVQVRVHQESRPGYELDRHMHEVKAQLDPNILLQESFQRLESRVSSALEPDEAIRRYKLCVFVGDPGAGKTTLLKYLTLKSADGALDQLPDLPLRVELNAFVTSGFHDLFDFAASEWDERYNFPKVEARAAMEARLNEGSVLLLLDALDETVVGDTAEEAEASYQQVVDTVIQIATRYPLVPIVVTARKAGYHQRSSLLGFTELEVLDFRLEDIQAFVDKWFACYTDPLQQANGTDLKNKLERTPRIRALAANPLLLTLIVLVYEAQLDLAERRAELYKEDAIPFFLSPSSLHLSIRAKLPFFLPVLRSCIRKVKNENFLFIS